MHKSKKLLNPEDFQINCLDLFYQSFFDREYEFAKWFFSFAKSFGVNIDIHLDNDILFKTVCADGGTEMATWLCSLDNKFYFKRKNIIKKTKIFDK